MPIRKLVVLNRIIDTGLIAIIRADVADHAARIAEACAKGGVGVLEITFTVPGAAKVIEAPWYEFLWFANDESARFELGLALAAMLLLIWGIRLDRQGRGRYLRKLRDVLLAFIGVVSFLCYFNFGKWHFPNRTPSARWRSRHFRARSAPRPRPPTSARRSGASS